VINLFYSLILLISSLTSAFFTYFFFSKNNPLSNVLDFYSRIHLNEGYISLFYFFWTSFWYLPSAYLALLTFSYYSLFVKFLTKLSALVTLTLTGLYLLEFYEYSFLNLSCTYLVMDSDLINTLLTNSINKYHPFIFYISTLHLFKPLLTNSKLPNLIKVETLVIIFTLALGSWWASQEGSWGGWWNWDPSEVFGLLIMISILIIGHNSLRNLSKYMSVYNQLLTSVGIFFTYFFIQLNFDIVSHNFGTKVGAYVSSTNSLLLISALLLVVILLICQKLLRVFSGNLVLYPKFNCGGVQLTGLLPKTYISTLVSFLVVVSFSLLVNDFLWKFLAISVSNYFIDYSVIVNLLTLTTLFVIWDLQPTTTLVTSVFYLYQPCMLPALLLVQRRFSITSSLHLTVLLGLISNNSLYSKTLTHWAPFWEGFTVGTLDASGHQNLILSLNQFSLGITPKKILVSFYNEYSHNFVSSGSSNEIHTFTHTLTPNTLTQELLMGGVLSRSVVEVLSYDLNSITFLATVGLIYIGSLLFRKKIIVF
jgi:hypothetical protein